MASQAVAKTSPIGIAGPVAVEVGAAKSPFDAEVRAALALIPTRPLAASAPNTRGMTRVLVENKIAVDGPLVEAFVDSKASPVQFYLKETPSGFRNGDRAPRWYGPMPLFPSATDGVQSGAPSTRCAAPMLPELPSPKVGGIGPKAPPSRIPAYTGNAPVVTISGTVENRPQRVGIGGEAAPGGAYVKLCSPVIVNGVLRSEMRIKDLSQQEGAFVVLYGPVRVGRWGGVETTGGVYLEMEGATAPQIRSGR
jgi:hypothetical protein